MQTRSKSSMAILWAATLCASPLLIAYSAHASPVSLGPNKTLTWEDCLRLTGQSNPSLKAAQFAYDQAVAQKESAFGGFFPVVSLNVGGTHTFSQPSGQSATSTDSFNATANLTQNLFNGFADRGRYDQARENERSLLQGLLAAKASASQQLKIAFAGLIYARDYVHLSEEIIKRREYNLSLVQLRFEGGRENKGSLLLSKAYLQEAKYNRLQAETALIEAEVTMGNTLGLEGVRVSDVVGAPPASSPPTNVDFKSLAASAPNYLQAVAAQEQNRAGIVVARASLLPTLNLTASAGKMDSMFVPQGDRWQIGLGLTIPVFNGGHDYYALRAAQEGFNSAAAIRFATEGQTILQITQAYDAYLQAVEKAKVDLAYLEAAITRAEIARQKYNNGLQTFEEWDLVENDLINRQRNALGSQRDRISAEANWENSLGKGSLP